MKKTLITVGIVLLFTVLFMVIFHFTSGASNISTEDTIEISSETVNEDNGESVPVSTDEGEGYSENDNSPSELAEASPPPSTVGGVEEFDLKEYIKEKIVPVVAGVAAAVFTIIVSLQPVITAVKAIRNLIKAFSNKDEERNASFKESNEVMLEQVKRLEAETAKIPALEEQIKTLVDVNGTLTEVLVLGFTSNADVVRSGRGKKMSLLLKKVEKYADEQCSHLRESVSAEAGGDKV